MKSGLFSSLVDRLSGGRRLPATGSAAPDDAAVASRALIASFGMERLFEPSPEGSIAGVAHIQSGMRCLFETLEGATLRTYEGLPDGDDVSCAAAARGFVTTLFATRYPEPASLQDHLAEAVQAIRQRFPDARPVEGETVSAGREDGPPHLAARFAVTEGGQQRLTRAAVAQVGDWTLSARTTGPLANTVIGDLQGEIALAIAINAVAKRQAASV